MSEQPQKTGAPFNCSTAIVFVIIIFICGCALLWYVPQLRPAGEATATATAPPRSPATPIVWTLTVPSGGTQGLWTEEALQDESCWDCIIGDLTRGTTFTPLSPGCRRAEWDESFSYCHVRVLSGELADRDGWVNEQFIEK